MLFKRLITNSPYKNVNTISSPTSYETGWLLPSVGENLAGINPAWTNPNNITTLTTSTFALNAFLNTSNTRALVARAFDFSSISDAATIDGVAVRVNMKASIPDSVDTNARLLISGSLAGTSLATSTLLASSFTMRTYGNSTALWGNTLTPAIVKASNFGFGLVIDNPNDSDDDISVASIEMNVYFTV